MSNNALSLAEYKLPGGQLLSYETVKNYIAPGATDQEVLYFIELCKAQKLNPFVKDAYLVKFGSQPAQIIVGKDVFIKRANANPNFDGMKAGIVVLNGDGKVEEREGSLKLPGEQVVGGWCEVYLKDKSYPTKALVSFEEYAQKTKEGKLNSMWSIKGATMIRKVAQSQALREAFPEELRGLYQQEEMGVDIKLSDKEIIPGMASNKQKNMIMALAAQKDLFSFDNVKDTSKLEYFCTSNGYCLKELKFEEADEVLELLAKYEPKKNTEDNIQDVEYTEITEDNIDDIEVQETLL
ncbi:phage recombination protein Bet [Terrisporobacter sp.]|uniref:phage recombination protein Bet n=1 Tax=Terrisporobacter sp. TaxID=1965305 RepID=UPI002636D507|nr:phage recombination protein Bet [Terrisporobacter sp.]